MNIFHVGGATRKANAKKGLSHWSSKPGEYDDAYIADYGVITQDFETLYGTSFSVQVIGAKLAMLYKALNVNHEWSMRDAMHLLMTTRPRKFYSANLTWLLVRDENRRILIGENGETFLLPEAELRKRLLRSPFYRKKR